jgi:hypothetical protein
MGPGARTRPDSFPSPCRLNGDRPCPLSILRIPERSPSAARLITLLATPGARASCENTRPRADPAGSDYRILLDPLRSEPRFQAKRARSSFRPDALTARLSDTATGTLTRTTGDFFLCPAAETDGERAAETVV